MNSYFLVTSAININSNDYFNNEVRLQQTLNTANTIKKYVPNAFLILVEGGVKSLSDYQKEILLKKYNDIIDLTKTQFMTFIHNVKGASNESYAPIKGPCELFLMKESLRLLKSFIQDGRIFKITGRYLLNEKFNINDHFNEKTFGKYCFKEKLPGYVIFDPKKNINYEKIPYFYVTRLYSICSSIIDQSINHFDYIFDKIIELYDNDNYTDLEHHTYKHLDKSFIHEIKNLGILRPMPDGTYQEA